MAHLNKRNLVRESHHGFMEGKSCLTNLLSFLETATSYDDQVFPVDILYFDFSKAFDKVSHQRVITKLKAHGTMMTLLQNGLKDGLQIDR